ncbi:MAG: 3-mercaptopyruvate sulfurtransferase [Alphaproteobacteria bacterium]|nr:3-mercaptopyruvate sulfurtransferase [Alphaproteobacteria bacterium]
MSDTAPPLVTTAWLTDHLGDGDVKVLDASYHLPTVKRDADAEFRATHIPGAVRFDIDAVCEPGNPLPHMIPSTALFANKVGALGVASGDHVVVYDVYGMQSAARAWWMFRLFGHDRVSVLNGGLPKWTAEGRPTEAGAPTPSPASFEARLRPELVRVRDDLLRNIDGAEEQVVDARAAGRFTGEEPEPRAGMRSGHIPGSRSLPFTTLLSGEHREIAPPDQLHAAFDAAGLDLDKPMVASCGSGVTACVIALAAHVLGKPGIAVYDGSWSEWGGRDDTPIETGPAA